jgi:hypothetical protein
MEEYKDLKTGAPVSVGKDNKLPLPSTGAKMLLKSRPPVAKEVPTD